MYDKLIKVAPLLSITFQVMAIIYFHKMIKKMDKN